MKQRKTHIASLAFLMLVLFVSPITVKAIHHHEPAQISTLTGTRGESVLKLVNACPVCQFEFVTFLAYSIPEYFPFSRLVSPDCCETIPGLKGISFTCYSLRAPPVV
jgi:hypothetical protein